MRSSRREGAEGVAVAVVTAVTSSVVVVTRNSFEQLPESYVYSRKKGRPW